MSISVAAGRLDFARRLTSREALTSDTALLVYLALVKFAAHMLVAGNYGYFRDELYYIIAGRHLQFGYVDFPPMIAVLAALLNVVAGDGLVAIHVVPALAGALVVLLTGLMARQLGGGRYAQALAAVGSLVMLTFLGTGSLFSMDALDELWWALAAYVLIRLLQRDDPRLWLLFGLVAGIGLTTKLTMLFFGFGVTVGLLLTPARRHLRTWYPWAGGALALAFLVPYALWNAANGWPTPEFWTHYGGIVGGQSPLDFLLSQLVTTNPLTLPLTIAGLAFYFSRAGKPYRLLGWTYVALYLLFTLAHAKSYFLAPAYPMLFAGGAVALASWMGTRGRAWLRPVYIGALALSGLLLAPGVMPVLPPAVYGHYYGFLAGSAGANQASGTPLPQILADRFGWRNMTATVARVYDSLPPGERAQACVFTANYGEASALNLLGAADHLPPAISGHNTYYLWGPGSCSGQVIITVGIPRADIAQSYADVTPAATITCANCVTEESDVPVYIARQPRGTLRDLWVRVKHYN